ANCKRLVESAGGRITLESAEGKGTTVAFWLPAAP
ncbi:MAG: ATP-binding protein, partial [Myxococcales bacterium]